MKNILLAVTAVAAVTGCGQGDALREAFADPPAAYRPMPFWHLNGELTREEIRRQITEAKEKSGYGGMTVLPVSPLPHWFDGHLCPGMTPEYLSEDYFDMYAYMLEVSEGQGTQIVLYDDIDFPSGSAGGRLLAEYPDYCRKYLVKDEFTVAGGREIVREFDRGDKLHWLALSAMNTATLEVIDLQDFLAVDRLLWKAPAGEWKIMAFYLEHDVGPPHGHLVDYMDPVAVDKLMEMTYAEYDRRFGKYFGNVITKTFFDDVGFIYMEQTWNRAISDLFERNTGRNPALYYPALFYDIGSGTEAARVAFHNARAELLAEGYVKTVAEWSARRGLKSMGHPPSNYGQNTVVASGDVLKFYRHPQIPLLDVIFHYGHGRDGYKQITSAADIGDKGVVGAELNGAFQEDMDSLELYRVAMEAMARGVNFIVPYGLWYDTHPDNIRIPPLISWENPYWGEAVKNYSDFTSRSCLMLQDGRRVVDVGLLWPIQALQAESWIYRDATSGLFVGEWLPDNINNYQLSGILTDRLRRDFTYVHPEDLAGGKVRPEGDRLVLDNEVNRQEYRVLIMPGGNVLSAESLRAVKAYYDGGGKVIATVNLPVGSAEFGRDGEVRAIVSDIFGGYPTGRTSVENDNGGIFCFLPDADKQTLAAVLDEMGLTADVSFDETGITPYETGCLNYTHKQKDGRDIYYFCDTTDRVQNTQVTLRGRLRDAEIWDPHTGRIVPVDTEYITDRTGETFSRLNLTLDVVRSVFVVGRQ